MVILELSSKLDIILSSLLMLAVVMFFPFVPFKLPVLNGFKLSLKFNVNIPVDEL